jgi:cytochrome c553
MTCHGENGEGVQENGFPYLAGMNAAYIAKQLKDLQGRSKISDVMNPIAKGLTILDIESVSAYYASLPVINKVEKSSSPEKLEAGRLMVERGLWNKGVPACYACHGPNAVGVGESFPPLINQGKIFIMKELHAWQKGTRNNDPAMLMKTIAKKLSQKEIEAVAEYLSSLSPIKTAEVKK